LEQLGFAMRNAAELHAVTEEVLKNAEIEGEILDRRNVRSSVARRLGVPEAGVGPEDRRVEGIVEVTLDATHNFSDLLTAERLFAWQAALFPTGRSRLHAIRVGAWRDDADGPMRVISGPVGHERIHYDAPPASHVDREMRRFLTWFNKPQTIDGILHAGMAHLWFVTIHPFEDGNGRVSRAIADLALARADGSALRFYSMSTQIEAEKKQYYDSLERAQKGGMEITPWLTWFLGCLDRALVRADASLAGILKKSAVWGRINAGVSVNERQRLVLNALLDRGGGDISTSKYAKLAHCSLDTALRDIKALVGAGVFVSGEGGGRSTNYRLRES
jgi:Fic family protein